MKLKLSNNKTLIGILFLGFLAVTLPITILLLKDTTNLASRATLPDMLETEAGVLSSSGVSKQTDSGASGGSYVLFNKTSVTNAPTPSSPPVTTVNIVGIGLSSGSPAGDKSNRQLREGAHAIRFVAEQSSQIKYVRIPWTNRTDPYGGGNGGSFRFGIQSVNGSKNPTGTWIGQTVDKSIPIQSGAFVVEIVYPNGATLQKGQTYAFVMQNISSSPNSNWGSVNMLYSPDGYPQPRDPDTIWLDGSHYVSPYNWTLNTSTTPVWDVLYANGIHQGTTASRGAWDHQCSVSSTCRWTFTYSGPTITVYEAGGAFNGTGNPKAEVKVNGSSKATATLSSKDRAWSKGNLSSSVTLNNGDSVEVIYTGTSQTMPTMLLRDQDAINGGHPLASYPYNGGDSSHRAWQGSNPVWSSWASHNVLQTYLK